MEQQQRIKTQRERRASYTGKEQDRQTPHAGLSSMTWAELWVIWHARLHKPR